MAKAGGLAARALGYFLVATVVAGTNCTDNLPGEAGTVTFTNAPLFDIQANFRDGGSGETEIVSIQCDGNTALDDPAAVTNSFRERDALHGRRIGWSAGAAPALLRAGGAP